MIQVSCPYPEVSYFPLRVPRADCRIAGLSSAGPSPKPFGPVTDAPRVDFRSVRGGGTSGDSASLPASSTPLLCPALSAALALVATLPPPPTPPLSPPPPPPSSSSFSTSLDSLPSRSSGFLLFTPRPLSLPRPSLRLARGRFAGAAPLSLPTASGAGDKETVAPPAPEAAAEVAGTAATMTAACAAACAGTVPATGWCTFWCNAASAGFVVTLCSAVARTGAKAATASTGAVAAGG